MESESPAPLLQFQVAYESARVAYENGERQRTSVKRWMMNNHDDFCEMLKEMFPGRIDWIWLTSWFHENGFRNRDGSDLKRETVRRVWIRVVEEKSKAGG